MKNEWVKRNKWIFVAGPVAFAGFVALCGAVVMQLWNWLAPALFGWHTITLWQALGILVLSRILFGSWTGHHGRGHHGRERGDHGGDMTPEEREKLREGMRARWCGPREPAGEPGKTA